ncbi:YciI family protein [Cohnella endophytica]|uniref:YciI family protein n=1 Tax=Cohnella endophytica TaxID=2419778 RepID=A0A494Y5Y7_9BACL|nr:YciI family protein [Cohnella endophytica]RKP58090.1 YciI family protein [Cohnella endophytica]
MRYLLMVKAGKHAEAGVMPSRELVDAMSEYNERLAQAGVLLAAEGLQPSASGIRIAYPMPGDHPVVTVGPFLEDKKLVAGYTLIDVGSEEEAVEWALRMPDPSGYGEGEIELRQLKSK